MKLSTSFVRFFFSLRFSKTRLWFLINSQNIHRNFYLGGGGGYAPGNGSSGYGDPHFHILGRDSSQDDICFDFNDEPGTEVTLIEDNSSGFKVVGTLFKPDENEKGIYFKNVHIRSPYNTEFFVDQTGWNINTNLRVNPSFDWGSQAMTYADMILGNYQVQDHGGHKISVTIIGGVSFE